HTKGERPSREEIEARLGPLVAPPATGKKADGGRRRRRTS
ncbi:hypothetical protein MNBD_ALPHA12-270, partial [hydrothermal vent metagenome]